MRTTWIDSFWSGLIHLARLLLNVSAMMMLQLKKGVEQLMRNKSLRKSKDNCVIGGVLGGIAEYFDISPLLVRILFIFFVPSSMPVFLYFVLYLVMPNADDDDYRDDSNELDEQDAEWSDF